jgi:hypothetical protein
VEDTHFTHKVRRNDMLRINTPGGIFTVREKDVANTEDAKLLWNCVNKSEKTQNHPTTTDVEQMVNCLRGKKYYGPEFAYSDAKCFLDMTELRALNIFSTYKTEEKNISIVSNDDVDDFPLWLLKERFQLFDDYFTDNPEATSITLPFDACDIFSVIESSFTCNLVHYYDVVCFLNPKSNLYWFQFCLEGMAPEKVIKLSENFTEEEKTCLFAYGERSNLVIPSRSGHYYLALFDSVRSVHALIEAIYREKYPSYAFCTLVSTRWHRTYITNALLTWDFSVDKEDAYYTESHVRMILIQLMKLHISPGSRSITLSKLARRGKKAIPATLPYGLEFDPNTSYLFDHPLFSAHPS